MKCTYLKPLINIKTKIKKRIKTIYQVVLANI